MSLKNQKRLAADVLNVGKSRVWINPEKVEDVAGIITRDEIRKLIHEDVIKALPEQGVSRGRARIMHSKRKRGLRKGMGSRSGKKTARTPGKRAWINKIRAIRGYLTTLKTRRIIQKDAYRKLYLWAKGGMFSDTSHIERYIETHKLTRRR